MGSEAYWIAPAADAFDVADHVVTWRVHLLARPRPAQRRRSQRGKQPSTSSTSAHFSDSVATDDVAEAAAGDHYDDEDANHGEEEADDSSDMDRIDVRVVHRPVRVEGNVQTVKLEGWGSPVPIGTTTYADPPTRKRLSRARRSSRPAIFSNSGSSGGGGSSVDKDNEVFMVDREDDDVDEEDDNDVDADVYVTVPVRHVRPDHVLSEGPSGSAGASGGGGIGASGGGGIGASGGGGIGGETTWSCGVRSRGNLVVSAEVLSKASEMVMVRTAANTLLKTSC